MVMLDFSLHAFLFALSFFVQIQKPELIWDQWFPMLFGFRFLMIYLNCGIRIKVDIWRQVRMQKSDDPL